MTISSRTPDDPTQAYGARHLQVLEGLEAVRKRPGMYIGSTDGRGLMHCTWEIFDNAVDEAIMGFCAHIRVILRADGSVEVQDTGRGMPVDIHPKTGLTGVELIFTKLHAGGKFGGGGYATSGGLHGVGASVVNALSERLDVQVDRGGKTYEMSFRRGEPGIFADGAEKSPDSAFTPFTDGSELRVIGKAKRGVTGSRVRWWVDRQIFLKSARFDTEELVARLRQTSFLVPGLDITLEDLRGEEPEVQEFRNDGGLAEFAEFLATDPGVTAPWRLQGTGSFVEEVPQLDERGHLVSTELERECQVDVVVRWGTQYDTKVASFVNVIETHKGGTHVQGFEQALLKVFRKQLELNSRRLKVGNDKVEKDDILAGLTAVVTVRFPEPQFEGQTKEVLGTSAVRGIVAKVVEEELNARLSGKNRNDKAQATLLLEKVTNEMKTRISARTHKENQRRKNALESSTLPAKLADCRSSDIDRTELFIVEGDSAMGTAKAARHSDFQALLPIRGKILNVQKASVGDMLKNVECASIIQVIGAGSGRSFSLDDARYGKVIIMTDADSDGSHIRTLLLTLFFRYMRPLVAAGRVFSAVPPLHRIEVAGGPRTKSELIYTYSESEMRSEVARLSRKGRKIKQPIQRYKGLGEMDADQLADTTMDPRHRTLRRITLGDAEAAEKVFDLLMGSDVAPRKEFITDSSARLDRERIDA